MLFDRFCRLAEQVDNLHQFAGGTNDVPGYLRRLAREARVFVFDARPGVLKPQLDKVHHADLFLPFPVMALEDQGSCVVLSEIPLVGAPGLPSRPGYGPTRVFVEICPIDGMKPEAYTDGIQYKDLTAGYQPKEFGKPGSTIFTFGEAAVKLSAPTVKADGQVEVGIVIWSIVVASREGIATVLTTGRDLTEEQRDTYVRATFQNFTAAMTELLLVNTPEHFILESRPAREVKRKSAKARAKIERTDQRPIYTLLYPAEIRKRLGLPPVGTHASPAPHERRAHFRTFKSDRYKAAKGKRRFFPATWVGPSEAVLGGKRYRVILDHVHRSEEEVG